MFHKTYGVLYASNAPIKKDWRSIIHPAKEITLQRAKMSASFPTAALYGSH